jgi:PAS domain S-box-containing protein
MLAKGIPHPFFLLGENLHIQFANEEFCEPFGRTAADVQGLHISEVLGPQLYREHEPHLRAALAGKQAEYESTIRGPSGEEHCLRISDRPAFDADGRICGVFSQSHDITDLRRVERDARESEARFRMVAQGVPNFLLFVNKDLHIEFCNDHFLANTRWTKEAAYGRHISEVIGPRYAQRRDYYLRALAGETVTCEASGVVGNEEGFFRLHYEPSYDEQGNIRGVFSVATDISKRRKVELALEAKQAELTRSNQDLEQFAYVASHDLKAPLRAMTLLVQWIREDLGDYDAGNLQENLGLLEQRTQRLGRLLDDLLAYSRVGRKVGEHRMTDCNELVRDVVELAGAPEHIKISVAPDLPAFETYGTPLEQVFRNLIGNAVKHHPGPVGNVKIACEDSGDFYVFGIEDDGEGIPQEYAERVFQMFQTLKPRDEVEGSGMGLAIVQRIVAWQGGRIWFEPAPGGKGTVFKFQWKKVSRQPEAAPTKEVKQWRTASR